MSPTWGGGGNTWQPPTPPPPPPPTPTQPAPTTPGAPKPIAVPAPPLGGIRISPGKPAAIPTRPIVVAPRKKGCPEPHDRTPDDAPKRREAPAKPAKATKKYPWELARDYFIARARRPEPVDFRALRKSPPPGLVDRSPHPGPRPVTLFDEDERALLAPPPPEREPIPNVLAPGTHALVFHSPNIFRPYDVEEFRARVVREVESAGAEVTDVDIDGRVVTVHVKVG